MLVLLLVLVVVYVSVSVLLHRLEVIVERRYQADQLQ